MSNQRLSFFLRIIFAFQAIGLLAELLLLDHVESNWQKLPIVVMATSMILLFFDLYSKSKTSKKLALASMYLTILCGLIGVYQHFRGNTEFEFERELGLSTSQVLIDSLKGAYPVLAPGSMIPLGLVGILAVHLIHKTRS